MRRFSVLYVALGFGFIAAASAAQPGEEAAPPPTERDALAPPLTEPAQPAREVPEPIEGQRDVSSAPGSVAAPSVVPPVVTTRVTPEESADAALPESVDEGGKKKAKDKKGRRPNLIDDRSAWGKLEIGGRVFARGEFSSREVGSSSHDSLDLSVRSARLDVFYEAPVKWLSMDVEFDISGNPEMKDAFVQARGENFFARIGQFKPPVSAMEMESPWELPLADRGFINDLLLDYLDVAGRRPGVLVGWRGRGGIKPRISVGAFQGSVLEDNSTVAGDRDVELIEDRDLKAQGFAARFDVDLAGVDMGVFYQHRVGSPTFPETEHYPTGGLDLTWDHTLASGGVRVWADWIIGASWYELLDKTADDDDAVFFSGRVLGAYRFGGVEDESFYVEPFGMFGLLDPDADVAKDFAWEAVLGINVGLWRRGRLTLQGEINEADENFPNHTAGYLFGMSPDRVAVILQAGMAF